MGGRVKQIFGICLVFRLVFCVLTFPLYEDQQLYVGSSCIMANGRNGTCTKFVECPSKMQEVHEGRYDQSDRCGFEDFTEIVCCGSVNITEKLNSVSPADAACQEYGNEVSQTGKSVSFHILGGVDAETNEFPHMAALGYASRDGTQGNIRYTCGGTLISRQHVLTAAHCVNNRDEDVPVEVRVGSTDLADVAGDTTQRVRVLSVTSHPGYKRSRNYNDLAIITLREPVRLTNSVQPACLLTKSLQNIESSGNNQTLIVVGWGSTEFAGDGSPKLKKAVGLRFVEFDECSKAYENKTRLPNGLDSTMICAIDPDRTRQADTCTGDSGGPLLLSSSSSQVVVAAVTAFGQACGGSTPSVYTSVYDYMSWIEDQVWPSSEKNKQPA